MVLDLCTYKVVFATTTKISCQWFTRNTFALYLVQLSSSYSSVLWKYKIYLVTRQMLNNDLNCKLTNTNKCHKSSCLKNVSDAFSRATESGSKPTVKRRHCLAFNLYFCVFCHAPFLPHRCSWFPWLHHSLILCNHPATPLVKKRKIINIQTSHTF